MLREAAETLAPALRNDVIDVVVTELRDTGLHAEAVGDRIVVDLGRSQDAQTAQSRLDLRLESIAARGAEYGSVALTVLRSLGAEEAESTIAFVDVPRSDGTPGCVYWDRIQTATGTVGEPEPVPREQRRPALEESTSLVSSEPPSGGVSGEGERAIPEPAASPTRSTGTVGAPGPRVGPFNLGEPASSAVTPTAAGESSDAPARPPLRPRVPWSDPFSWPSTIDPVFTPASDEERFREIQRRAKEQERHRRTIERLQHELAVSVAERLNGGRQ